MVVTGLEVTVYQGNPRQVNHTVLNQDVDGSPAKDLTGIAARWVVSKISTTSGEPLPDSILVKDSQVSSGVTFPDAPAGKLRANLTAANTTALPLGKHYFECELYDPLGANTTLPLVVATGTITVKRNVT